MTALPKTLAALNKLLEERTATVNAQFDADLTEARRAIDAARAVYELALHAYTRIEEAIEQQRVVAVARAIHEVTAGLVTPVSPAPTSTENNAVTPAPTAPAGGIVADPARDEPANVTAAGGPGHPTAGEVPAANAQPPSQTEEAAPSPSAAGSSSGVAPAVEDTGRRPQPGQSILLLSGATGAIVSQVGHDVWLDPEGAHRLPVSALVPGHHEHDWVEKRLAPPAGPLFGGAAAAPEATAQPPVTAPPDGAPASKEKRPCPRCQKPVTFLPSGEPRAHMLADGRKCKPAVPLAHEMGGNKSKKDEPADEWPSAKTAVDNQAADLFDV